MIGHGSDKIFWECEFGWKLGKKFLLRWIQRRGHGTCVCRRWGWDLVVGRRAMVGIPTEVDWLRAWRKVFFLCSLREFTFLVALVEVCEHKTLAWRPGLRRFSTGLSSSNKRVTKDNKNISVVFPRFGKILNLRHRHSKTQWNKLVVLLTVSD